jgi:hypothetical protein
MITLVGLCLFADSALPQGAPSTKQQPITKAATDPEAETQHSARSSSERPRAPMMSGRSRTAIASMKVR